MKLTLFLICNIVVIHKYLLLLSVSVIPWEDTLKWTMVATGRGFRDKVNFVALETASGPVNDSVSTEFR